MATTPRLALPYPVGTDRVMDGDNVIQALAEGLDFGGARASLAAFPVAQPVNAIVKPNMQCGYVEATTSASAIVTVTFPAPFTSRVLFITAFTISGPAVNPVVSGAALTLSTVTLAWPGNVNTLTKFCWLAFGN
jgi:hypothetical protein